MKLNWVEQSGGPHEFLVHFGVFFVIKTVGCVKEEF